MSENNMETTNVEEVDVNLDEIFNGAPSAGSITLPKEGEDANQKPNIFSRGNKVDLDFLDPKEDVTEEPKAEEKVEETKEAPKADAAPAAEAPKEEAPKEEQK